MSAVCIGPPSEGLRLRAKLEPRGPAAAVILSDEQVAAIGGGAKTPPVRVTVHGQSFSGRIGRMGGESLLGFNRAIRERLSVNAGDEIELEIVHDDGPREVDVPEVLGAALDAEPAARTAFDGLAPSHRKEFARWVAEAKRPETCDRRVAETLTMLREGRTRR